MFSIISPKEHELHADKILHYQECLKNEHENQDYQDYLQSLTKDSHYIIFSFDEQGIIGGAALSHQGLVEGKNCYLLTGVCFHLRNDSLFLLDANAAAFDFLCCSFYEGLVRTVNDFAQSQKVDLVVFENPVNEQEDLKQFGKTSFKSEEFITRGSIELALGFYIPKDFLNQPSYAA